ncbi:adenylate/guanylate cyclase domain-containing protein [Emticicia sp. C21]|uniref:adenylate/guanylate cyclase domain-containing protein n=1 Tax=Emticicia sp. C21 TaxID=2302915 RepID=UPI000E3572D3|nr:adenylate/guanylate cyclase domain-containing protein [Emticicia sp. C21]RFS15676.1 adenylate/guanylate cyclase domain-containing protein [Emticicia sp. C21]
MKKLFLILVLTTTLSYISVAQNSKLDTATSKKGWRLFGNKKARELENLSREKGKIENEKKQLEKQNQDLYLQQHALDSQLVATNQSLKLMSEAQVKAEFRLLQQRQLLDSVTYSKVIDSLKISEQQTALEQKEAEVKLKRSQTNLLIVAVFAMLCLAVIFYKSMVNVKKYSKIIDAEKNKAENLLLNILPKEIAEELKKNGYSEARYYPKVSVLFSDFVGFTFLAEKLTPQELVAELDYCFKRFDRIMENNKIEKIKTIGDAYMAAGGVPISDDETHIRVVRAALEMQEFVEARKQQRKRDNLPYFEARVGIHTGELVAGIVGEKKFAFDLWGDTVNIASRVESVSLPGKVNISEDTYLLIKDRFICSDRGKKDIKNRGEKGMYFVESEIMVVEELV